MKFLAIFLVILSVFNMMLVEANESTQKPLSRRRRPNGGKPWRGSGRYDQGFPPGAIIAIN